MAIPPMASSSHGPSSHGPSSHGPSFARVWRQMLGDKYPAASSLKHVRHYDCFSCLILGGMAPEYIGALQVLHDVGAKLQTVMTPRLQQPQLLLDLCKLFPDLTGLSLYAIRDEPGIAAGTIVQAGRAELAQNTQKLEKISTSLRRAFCYQETLRTAVTLIQGAPRLISLTVTDTSEAREPRTDALSDIANVPWLNPSNRPAHSLRKLELVQLDLYGRAFHLTPWLTLTQLKTLKIQSCFRTEPFLRDLANLLRLGTLISLETFHLRPLITDAGVHAAMESVMNSFKGLKDVSLFINTLPLPRHQCLVQHGSTLTSLMVCNRNNDVYDYDDLNAILSACPNLTQLALHLPEVIIGSGYTWEQDWTLELNPFEARSSLHASLVSI